MTGSLEGREPRRGTVLHETRTDSIPGWIMFLFGLLSAMFAFGSAFLIPQLWGRLRGDFQSGLVGVILTLVFGWCAIRAFRSAFSSETVYHVTFSSLGITLNKDPGSFLYYADLQSIDITIRRPTAGARGMAVAKGVLSLFVGHVAGIGAAIGEGIESGRLVLSRSHGRKISVGSLKPDQLDLIADCATACNEKNVTVTEV